MVVEPNNSALCGEVGWVHTGRRALFVVARTSRSCSNVCVASERGQALLLQRPPAGPFGASVLQCSGRRRPHAVDAASLPEHRQLRELERWRHCRSGRRRSCWWADSVPACLSTIGSESAVHATLWLSTAAAASYKSLPISPDSTMVSCGAAVLAGLLAWWWCRRRRRARQSAGTQLQPWVGWGRNLVMLN